MINRYPLPWIEALPSWSKCQFRQEEVCFLDYVRSSHVILIFKYSWDALRYSPRSSRQAHQQTHQLAWSRVRSSMMRLMIVANRSKSCQKIEKWSTSPKASKVWEICKGHWFGGTFIEAPIFRQRTWVFVTTLTVFRALFARPKSSRDTTFALIIDKAKLIELLMRCPHQVFISAAHAFSPLLQLWDAFRVLGIKTTRELVAYPFLPLFQF